jgi:hypothetical protein
VRTPILLICTTLPTVLLAGCSPTGPEPEAVTFSLNGAAQSTTYVSGQIGGSAFTLTAEDYSGFGQLQFGVGDFGELRTYPISPFDSAASASVRSLQGMVYDTRLFGGRGQIVVTGNSCRTYSGIDPATGIYGTFTFCTVAGSFEFTARSQAGDSVVVTNGHFRWTVLRS